MIKKIDLKEGRYYTGYCRNTNIAQWYKDGFIFINFHFGTPYIETIQYFGNIKELNRDGFIPIQEIEINFDSIVDEKYNQDYRNSARKIHLNLTQYDLPGEIWKLIPEYNVMGYYVSNMGRVKKDNKIMKQNLSREYLILGLTDQNHIRKTHRVHRLVASVFNTIQNLDNMEVNHINGIKTDNRDINLEWISHSENCKHSYVSGNTQKKLTSEMVKKIKIMIRNGDVQKDIAKEFNISPTTVCEINKNKKWVNVK